MIRLTWLHHGTCGELRGESIVFGSERKLCVRTFAVAAAEKRIPPIVANVVLSVASAVYVVDGNGLVGAGNLRDVLLARDTGTADEKSKDIVVNGIDKLV